MKKTLEAIRSTNEMMRELMKQNGCEDTNIIEQPTLNIEELVNNECDELNNSFIQNGLLVVNGYQYLLDTYLANEVIKTYKDDETVISKMINITNHLSKMTLKDILVEFNMPDLISQLEDQKNIKIKKLTV